LPNGRSPLRSLLAATACAALLASCASKNGPTTTGSIDHSSRNTVEQAEKLKTAGRAQEAVALLRAEVGKNPNSKPLMLLYARTLADAGQNEEALAAFGKAYDAKNPNWRIPNAEGVLLDRLGRMPEAQQRYQAALQIAPDEPVILTNFGLSLALSDKPTEAETVLRRAAARPEATAQVRQNLALVLAIQGKYAEAEAIARKDLPAEQAAANVKYWKESFISKTEAAPPKAAAKPKPAKPAAKTAKPAAAPKPAPAAKVIEEPAPPPAAKVIEEPAPAKPAEAPLAADKLDLRT
jgi:Flp pilus assembly protein TadD